MVVIVKPGVIPSPPPPWFQTEVWTCSHCGATFKAEETDFVHIQRGRNGCGDKALMACPTCKAMVTLFEPGKSFHRVLEENPWLTLGVKPVRMHEE